MCFLFEFRVAVLLVYFNH